MAIKVSYDCYYIAFFTFDFLLEGMHSRTKLIQWRAICLIDQILADEIDVGSTLLSAEALTSNDYHAGPFEMRS